MLYLYIIIIVILFPISMSYGLHLVRTSNGIVESIMKVEERRRNQRLFMEDTTTTSSAVCVALINADFSIVKVGLAGALAGGFRGDVYSFSIMYNFSYL